MEAPEIREATRIIEVALRQKMPSSFHESLVSGVRLCMLFITLFPLRRRPKYRTGRPDYYASNVTSFLEAASGVLPALALFEPDDLLMGSNDGLLKVARTVQALVQASGRSFAIVPTFHLSAKRSMMPSTVVSASLVVNHSASSTGGPNMISDTVSVTSSSSSTDWCRLDALSIMSSPQQNGMSPLSPKESWVQVPHFDSYGDF